MGVFSKTGDSMRRLALAAFGVIGLIGWLALAPAQAQVSSAYSLPLEVGDALRRGEQLETERRWADALTHYEEAIRQFPSDATLERRFELARLHFDCQRRYGDASFAQDLDRMGVERALDLYNDVMVKIQSHYVETPNWKDLVERGLTSLEVAFTEPLFVKRNVPAERQGSIDAYRFELRRMIGARPIASRGDARATVAAAAELGSNMLGTLPTAIVLEFTCGASNSLDPYSAYLTPNQLAEVYSQIEGNFVGLGVELKSHDGGLLIVRVISRSPAQQAGIHNGDLIIAVDGKRTADYSTDQAANLLQGPAGSTVDVTVVTPGQPPRLVRARRERVEVPSVDDARIVDARLGVAYLKLVCFQKNTARDMDTALWQLHREGMHSLIIDLRGNPGGLLVAAVEVADRFVDQGIIVSTRGRNTQEDFTYSAHEEGTWRVPLVLIIDQDSASAAEILAGAIRDHHRGAIVGVRSYGKGSVQGIFPLSTTSAGIRLTTSRFYSPNGRPYSRVGVDPDIAVRQAARPVGASILAPVEDTMFQVAVQQAAIRSVAARDR